MRFLPLLFAFVLSTWSFFSYAWWNEDWTSRKKITLTGPSSEVTDVPVLIPLHTGNFDFFSASDNGGDVRLVAGDDKTALKFHFEKWDVANELALIWVKVPRLSAQTEIFLYYGNENATSAADPKGTYDASSAIYHFAEPQGNPQDSGSNNLHAQSSAHVAASFSNGGAGFDGAQSLILPPIQAAGGYSFSVWVKPTSPSGIIYQSDNVSVSLDDGLIRMQSGGRAWFPTSLLLPGSGITSVSRFRMR